MALAYDGHQDRPIKIIFETAGDMTNKYLIETRVVGDLFPRMLLRADGTLTKGNGTVAPT